MVVERKTHIPEDIDDDCVSRKAVLALATELSFDGVKGLEHWKCNHIDPLKVMELPAVPPKKVCIAEIKVERDEVEQLIAEKVEEIKRAICSRGKEADDNVSRIDGNCRIVTYKLQEGV